MKMITAKQAAEKWNTSVRNVQDLCKRGRIPGAERWGGAWMIPEGANRPADGRRKTSPLQAVTEKRPLVRKTPFLGMSDLYNTPGSADQVIEKLAFQPEAQALFAAEIAYSRGEIDKVYDYAQYFLNSNSGFYAVISGGMMLGLTAMWKGDANLWFQAKKHMYEAPWKDKNDRDIIGLSIASTDLLIRNTREFPDWFYRGCFEHLHPDAYPAARVYYIKYLTILAQEHAAGRFFFEDVSGVGLLRVLPFIIEPMIAQSVKEHTILAEIYLRQMCAIAYRQIGDNANAALHLDRAIALCLADDLYGILTEHRRQLGLFLDERIALVSPEAAKKVKELYKVMHEGWTSLHNAVMDSSVTSKLSDREREVARLAAFGFSDDQIANQLNISRASVKSMVQMARNKTGIKKRGEFALYI